MLRPALVCLACACPALAGPYQDLIQEAVRLQGERRAGDQPADRFSRAYLKLAEAVQKSPDRWEAFLYRILNRVDASQVAHQVVLGTLERMRAQRRPPEEIEHVRTAGRQYFDNHLKDAAQNYTAMRNAMGRGARQHGPLLAFATAAVKFGAREYLRDRAGGPGAIEAFKSAARSGYDKEICGKYIARCYLELGFGAYAEEEFEQAREHWEEGKRWTNDRELLKILNANIAGAFEMDHEFKRAEGVLREQIGRDDQDPAHWKNLGLVLGFQNRLKEALWCYARSREICRRAKAPVFLGLFHGNAWLRAAAIHGKLLVADGDLDQAWRLFMEYRRLFGDDYNFCLEFGSFLADMRQYDMAWTFLTRARDLQPHCPTPYQMLVEVAPRVRGTRDEINARIATAKEEHKEAFRRFDRKRETPTMQRNCGGLRDWADGVPLDREPQFLDPDPLAGIGGDALPGWLAKAAGERSPFEPWRPDAAAAAPAGAPAGPGSGGPAAPRPLPIVPLVVAVAALAGAGLMLFRRRTGQAA